MRQYVKVKIEKFVSKLIYDLHQEYDTKSMHMDKEVEKEIDETVDKLSHLIHKNLKDNS